MNYWFLCACFGVGVSVSAAMGPIFILTFNNSALRGFIKGFFTALGASIGDGILLFLGLMGTLTILGSSPKYQLAMDLIGGLLLILFGTFTLLPHQDEKMRLSFIQDSLIMYATKSFLSTVLNPLTLFSFMFIGARILPAGSEPVSTATILTGSIMTSLGSLATLSGIAYSASQLGKAISPNKLRFISIITGCILIFIGGYFFADAILVTVKIFVK